MAGFEKPSLICRRLSCRIDLGFQRSRAKGGIMVGRSSPTSLLKQGALRSALFVVITTIAARPSLLSAEPIKKVEAQPSTDAADSESSTQPARRAIAKKELLRVLSKLEEHASVEIEEGSLGDVLKSLEAHYDVKFRLNEKDLVEGELLVPITFASADVRLKYVLDLLLFPLGLDHYVDKSEIVIDKSAAVKKGRRKQLTAVIEDEVSLIDHLYRLSDDQKIELRRTATDEIPQIDDQIVNRKWDIAPLQFGNGSGFEVQDSSDPGYAMKKIVEWSPINGGLLFRKSVERVLTPEQLEKYAPLRVILDHGGFLGMSKQAAEKQYEDTVLSLTLFGPNAGDDLLPEVKELNAICRLVLIDCKVTEKGIAKLKEEMPDLKVEYRSQP